MSAKVCYKLFKQDENIFITKLVNHGQLDAKFLDFDNVLTMLELNSKGSDEEGNTSLLFYFFIFLHL